MVLLIAAYSSSGHEREPTFWSSLARSGSQPLSLGASLARLKSDASPEVRPVHDDAGRLQRPGPRLTSRGGLDARTGRVNPCSATREPTTHVEGDAASLDHDAYELGDGSAGPAADAGPFGEGHALTVADGPTRTNTSGRTQPSLRRRDCDGGQSERPTRETEVAIAQRENPSTAGPGISTMSGPGASGYFSAAATSGLMSMRQPVRRAARRAFCPSRPMARLSW